MSTDKRITNPPDRESDEARRNLSEQALDPRNAAGRDRIERVGDTGDRAQFRDLCTNELRNMRGELKGASDAMSGVNKAVESGQLKHGSPEWKQAFDAADAKYQTAVQNADRKLTPDFLNAIARERQLLSDEIKLLQAAKDGRRALTPDEVQRLGLRSNDPVAALEQRKQQDMALEDLSRSAGFARANRGLAWIRASAGGEQSIKDGMIQQGQAFLGEASAKDPKMEGDSNFQKNFKRVVKIATGQDVEFANSGDGTGMPSRNAQVIQEGGRTYIKDNNFKLPTGPNQTDAQNFTNPYTILRAVEESISSPLSSDNINGFRAAIDAADKIDRVRLAQKMQAEQDYMDRVLQGPNGMRIKSILDTMTAKGTEMDRQHAQMAALIPDLVKGPNGQPDQQAVATLEKLRACKTIEELETFLRNPQNAAEVTAFRNRPKGAEFISTLEQFKNNDKIVHQGEAEIAKYDPNFVKAKEDLAKDMALYHSSEDARAHFIRALVRDPKNQSPENTKLAQDTMRELAILNPNILKDGEFQQMAQFLGMRPDGKGGIEVATPGTGAGTTTLTDASTSSIRNAFQAYTTVKDGVPLDQNTHAIFQKAIADAATINPQEVAAIRQKMQTELAGKGWNQQLEQQFVAANQAVDQAFAKIAPDKQQQIAGIQQQIGRLNSTDATAAQQRQNLEGQLQAMGSDPAVKGWLDSRVQLANFYKANGPAVEARMAFEEANTNLMALEHAKAITAGLYGAALLKSGDKQNARAQLIQGARDPVALQLAPEIAQAIQAANDPTIMQEAQRAGDSSKEVPAGTTAAVNPQQFDAAVAALGQSMEALKQVQNNGQPLPANLDAIFQNAIQKNTGIDPKAVEAMGLQVQQQLLTGWTQEKEQQYIKINSDIATAEQAISPASQQALTTFAGTLTQGDQTNGQKMDAKMRELAASDPTMANYVKALDTARQYHQDPAVQKRDQWEAASQQLAQVAHGKAIAETLYAAALASTGNQADAAKAKTVMQSALTDKDLAKIYPPAAEVARQLGLAGGADNPLQPGATNPELAKIPGFTQLQQAEQIMQDKTLSPQQRIEKAGPLYAQAVEESKKINVTKLDQDLTAIGTRLKEIEAGAEKVKADPAALAKYQQDNMKEYQQLTADADKLSNMRLEPMKARLLAAIAYNGAAAELYDAAAKDPSKAAELKRTADAWNKQAADTLKSLEAADPRMWRENPTILGSIKQCEEHKKIDPGAANAIGQVYNLQKMVDFGVNGPIKGVQPLWMSMNVAGDALQTVGKIPVVGFIPGALGAGLSRSEEVRPGAAMALALAKNKDEKGANDAVASIRHQMANQGVYIVSDIASSYAGMAAGQVAVNMLGNRLGPVGKALTFAGAGLLGTTATNATLDWGASKVFGTDQRDTAELLSHSAASFGMTWGLHGLSNYKNMQTNMALNGTAGRPSLAESMAVWNKPTVNVNMTNLGGYEVSPLYKENMMGLNADARKAVLGNMQAKFTPEQFRALNPQQQYSAFLGAYNQAAKTLAADMAGGSKFMARLPFSGNMSAARAQLGAVETPWMFTGKGNAAWRFGTGAAGMGVYGLGEVNPFLTDKQTGERYTIAQTLGHMGTNAAWGGTASLASPLVGKAMEFTVKKPLEFTMGKPIAWLFNSEAAAASKAWTGFSSLESKSFSQIGSSFTGNWAIAGSEALGAARNRFLVGFGGGGGLGMLTHNPWMVNPETGKNYTWGESGGYGLKWGTVTGAGAVAAPYVMFGGKALLEKAGKPIYNYTVVPASEKLLAPAYNWARPAITSSRVFLGTQSDKVLKNPAIVSAYESITGSNAAAKVQAGWQRYAAVSLGPTAMLEGQGAGDLYAYHEWGRINQEADAILKAAREEEAKKKAAAPAGT